MSLSSGLCSAPPVPTPLPQHMPSRLLVRLLLIDVFTSMVIFVHVYVPNCFRHVVPMFESEYATRASSLLLHSIKMLLAERGGVAFYASYLEQVSDTSLLAKWKKLDSFRVALRAVLQYHKDATLRLMRWEKQASSSTESNIVRGVWDPTAAPQALGPAPDAPAPASQSSSSILDPPADNASIVQPSTTQVNAPTTAELASAAAVSSAAAFTSEVLVDPALEATIEVIDDAAIIELRASFADLYRCFELLLRLASFDETQVRKLSDNGRVSELLRAAAGTGWRQSDCDPNINPDMPPATQATRHWGGVTASDFQETMLWVSTTQVLWVGSEQRLSPCTALLSASLIEHAMTRYAISSHAAPHTAAALDEIAETWAGQLLGLLSRALQLSMPQKAPNYTMLGRNSVQPISAALDLMLLEQQELELLVERVVAMIGRACFVLGSPALAGLIQAWSSAAAPSLATHIVHGYLLHLLKHNANSFQPTTNRKPRPQLPVAGITVDVNAKEAITMSRKTEHLEAVVAGLAKLAWNLPNSMDALEMFGMLVKHRTEELDFPTTYLARGSALREQVRM
jgi:hypothetical protein